MKILFNVKLLLLDQLCNQCFELQFSIVTKKTATYSKNYVYLVLVRQNILYVCFKTIEQPEDQ